MAFQARKAERRQAKARVMLDGPSGSGKTYGALLLAKGLGGKVAIIDTENASADLYADLLDYDVVPFDPPYAPERYVEAINYCASEGYDVVIIDSISHEWNGSGGCLEIQSGLGGRFQDWAKVTPRHQKFIDGILRAPVHVVATCRTKTSYEIDEKSRKVQKVGTQPQQRDGLDYEMTVVFDLTQQHYACATKDRTRLFDGREELITADTGKRLLDWLNGGAAAPEPQPDWEAEKRRLWAELGKVLPDSQADIGADIKQQGMDSESACAYMQNVLNNLDQHMKEAAE